MPSKSTHHSLIGGPPAHETKENTRTEIDANEKEKGEGGGEERSEVGKVSTTDIAAMAVALKVCGRK